MLTLLSSQTNLMADVFLRVPPHELGKQGEDGNVVAMEIRVPYQPIIPMLNTVGGVVQEVHQPIQV